MTELEQWLLLYISTLLVSCVGQGIGVAGRPIFDRAERATPVELVKVPTERSHKQLLTRRPMIVKRRVVMAEPGGNLTDPYASSLSLV